MKENRFAGLTEFLKSAAGDIPALLPLNGDASFRRYYRASDGTIAVDAPPETQKNAEFVAIDQKLWEAGIRVPKILKADVENGYLLLEDLGDVLFSEASKGENQPRFYHEAAALLPKLAAADTRDLPCFDRGFILQELGIFTEWMGGKHLKLDLSSAQQEMLTGCFEFLVRACLSQPQIAMHRDFHSRNLMVTDGELAVIDFQDMVKGPLTYDAASLIYDCYINLPESLCLELKQELYQSYQKLLGADVMLAHGIKDFAAFDYYLTLTSLQRHVKVLGIFIRLWLRDGKNGYLKDLPRVLAYAVKECDAAPELTPLKEFLQEFAEGHLPCAQ